MPIIIIGHREGTQLCAKTRSDITDLFLLALTMAVLEHTKAPQPSGVKTNLHVPAEARSALGSTQTRSYAPRFSKRATSRPTLSQTPPGDPGHLPLGGSAGTDAKRMPAPEFSAETETGLPESSIEGCTRTPLTEKTARKKYRSDRIRRWMTGRGSGTRIFRGFMRKMDMKMRLDKLC